MTILELKEKILEDIVELRLQYYKKNYADDDLLDQIKRHEQEMVSLSKIHLIFKNNTRAVVECLGQESTYNNINGVKNANLSDIQLHKLRKEHNQDADYQFTTVDKLMRDVANNDVSIERARSYLSLVNEKEQKNLHDLLDTLKNTHG